MKSIKTKTRPNLRNPVKPMGILGTAVILIIILLLQYFSPKARTADAELHFIDVGQGDGAMIITDEVCVVIDCGPVSAGDGLISYIKRYTDSIDCLVLSHAHEDHMGAASELIREFEVSEVVMTGYYSDSAFFSRALDAMEEKNTKVTEAVAGDTLTVGDVTLELYAPTRDYNDANNNSIVLRASVDGVSALFTGDAEEESESDILAAYRDGLSSDILKIGHHGSSTSTTESFLLAVAPEYAVISCGDNNEYGHPHRETVKLLKEHNIPYYRTDSEGDIVFKVEDGKAVPSE